MNGRFVSKLAIALLVGGFAVSEVAAAGFQRSGGGTGPRGRSYTSQGSGSCAGGSCSSTQSVTGPNGRAVTRNNSGQCSGGQCTTGHTITGPGGRAFNRNSTFTRN